MREGCGDSERGRERDVVAEWVVWVVREVECSHTCVRVWSGLLMDLEARPVFSEAGLIL